MIFIAEDDKKKGVFIAKLESLGVYALLENWGQSNDEEIHG